MQIFSFVFFFRLIYRSAHRLSLNDTNFSYVLTFIHHWRLGWAYEGNVMSQATKYIIFFFSLLFFFSSTQNARRTQHKRTCVCIKTNGKYYHMISTLWCVIVWWERELCFFCFALMWECFALIISENVIFIFSEIIRHGLGCLGCWLRLWSGGLNFR